MFTKLSFVYYTLLKNKKSPSFNVKLETLYNELRFVSITSAKQKFEGLSEINLFNLYPYNTQSGYKNQQEISDSFRIPLALSARGLFLCQKGE